MHGSKTLSANKIVEKVTNMMRFNLVTEEEGDVVWGGNNESAVPVVQHGELMCNVIGHWTLEIWGKADLMCGEMFIGHPKHEYRAL